MILMPHGIEREVVEIFWMLALACLFALALAVCGLLLVAGVLRLFVS